MVRFICSSDNLVIDLDKSIKPKIGDFIEYKGKLYKVFRKGISAEFILKGGLKVYKTIYVSKERKKKC